MNKPTMKRQDRFHQTTQSIRHLAAGMLFSIAIANGEVSLTFDADLQGVTQQGGATSVLWSAYNGGSIAITTTTGWKDQCAKIDMNLPEFAAFKAELALALVNGGTLSYDILIAPDTIAAGSNPNYFETIYTGNSSGNWDQQFGTTKGQLAGGAWPRTQTFTVSYPIVAGPQTSDAIAQFTATSGYFDVFIGLNSGGTGYTGATFYIDNFKIAANLVIAPTVIPQLSITPAKRGLNMTASGGGNYDRQCIRTQGAELSWAATPEVAANYPKTYELTIAGHPGTQAAEVVMYFIPGSDLANSSNADYSFEDAAGLSWWSQGDGSGSMSFRYKVDNPNSNNSNPGGTGHALWEAENGDGNGGTVATVGSPTLVGTWKLSFSSSTAFTLTAPNGTTQAGTILPATAAQFEGNMYVYFGIVPNNAANLKLNTIFSRLKITSGAVVNVDQDFTTDTYVAGIGEGEFQVSATVPKAVVQVTPELGSYWINWTPIDPTFSGFTLIQSTDLGITDTWETNAATPIPTTGAFDSKIGQSMLLPADAVSSTTRDFFRLQKVTQ